MAAREERAGRARVVRHWREIAGRDMLMKRLDTASA